MHGFTLLELMVTVCVAAVLVTVGVPSFVSFVQNNRAAAYTNELVGTLNFARSEAIQHGAAITVCSSSNGSACSNATDWSNGWIVLGPGGDLIRARPASSGGAGILTGSVDQFQFQPRGSVGVTNPITFQVRLPNCTGNHGRDLWLSRAGRVSVSSVSC